MRASSSSMQEMFRNMQFPATKEQIMEQVRKQNVSSDITKAIQMIPDRQYESADSLMQAIEASSQQAGGGKSQGFGGTGYGGSGGGGPSEGGSSQSFGGRGGE